MPPPRKKKTSTGNIFPLFSPEKQRLCDQKSALFSLGLIVAKKSGMEKQCFLTPPRTGLMQGFLPKLGVSNRLMQGFLPKLGVFDRLMQGF